MAAAESHPHRLITNDQAARLVLRGLLGRQAQWRERVGDEAYQASIARWRALLGDPNPYPHAVYPADNPQSVGMSLREDEAWWRQALGDRYEQILAYRTALEAPDGTPTADPTAGTGTAPGE
jgi:hypothetical protein